MQNTSKYFAANFHKTLATETEQDFKRGLVMYFWVPDPMFFLYFLLKPYAEDFHTMPAEALGNWKCTTFHNMRLTCM